jgi:hypothetical protein
MSSLLLALAARWRRWRQASRTEFFGLAAAIGRVGRMSSFIVIHNGVEDALCRAFDKLARVRMFVDSLLEALQAYDESGG